MTTTYSRDLYIGGKDDPTAPFGAVKQSGIGCEGGHEGVLDYTESKYTAVSR
jgi:succinate-semialdehyde dehydrogenase/glutarate-semialdehyde dehydrogenase